MQDLAFIGSAIAAAIVAGVIALGLVTAESKENGILIKYNGNSAYWIPRHNSN